MGIDLRWDNAAQSVMLCQVEKNWTWDDMDVALTKMKDITDHAERTIAAIIDLSAGVSIPGSLLSPATFKQAKKMLKMGDTGSRGSVIVVGANSMIRTAYNTFRGLDKEGLSNVSFANTLDEARAMLKDSYTPATS